MVLTFIRNFSWQISFFVIGLLIELGAPLLLNDEGMKRLLKVLGLLLLVIALIWGGIEFGVQLEKQSAEPTTTTPVLDIYEEEDGIELSIEDIPFYGYAWVSANESDMIGEREFAVLNQADNQRAYRFLYTIPPTSTVYSGAGIGFNFVVSQDYGRLNPQDFTDYEKIIISITFTSIESRCDLILKDISEDAIPSVPLSPSPNVILDSDIEVRVTGLTREYSIPLEAYYFQYLNGENITQITCAVDTRISLQEDEIIINHISFLK